MARLPAGTGFPWWASYSAVASVTRTADETSVVAEERLVPVGVPAERDFVAFAVEGPIDFAEIGILATLTSALAAAAISCLAVSTFDTDIVLVRSPAAPAAEVAWAALGWQVVTA